VVFCIGLRIRPRVGFTRLSVSVFGSRHRGEESDDEATDFSFELHATISYAQHELERGGLRSEH